MHNSPIAIQTVLRTGGGGGAGGPNLPPPGLAILAPAPFFLGFLLFALSSVAKYYAMLRSFPLFLPLPALPSPTSRTPPTPYSPGHPPPCSPVLYVTCVLLFILPDLPFEFLTYPPLSFLLCLADCFVL